MPRLYCPLPMTPGDEIALPANATRHVQVLRLQPGDAVALFQGGLPSESEPSPMADPGWFDATITHMGRSEARVRIGQHHAAVPTAHPRVHIACGVPANERMDWLVEKATELGAASIQPLMTERSVLRLKGERADKKQAHWQAVAVAACEQCGRTAVPWVRPTTTLNDFLAQNPLQAQATQGGVLSLRPQSRTLPSFFMPDKNSSATRTMWLLSGPEGGLSPTEESAAIAQGWQPLTLGRYTLRAETAPLVALAQIAVCAP